MGRKGKARRDTKMYGSKEQIMVDEKERKGGMKGKEVLGGE